MFGINAIFILQAIISTNYLTIMLRYLAWQLAMLLFTATASRQLYSIHDLRTNDYISN